MPIAVFHTYLVFMSIIYQTFFRLGGAGGDHDGNYLMSPFHVSSAQWEVKF